MTKICIGILTCQETKPRFAKFMRIHKKFFDDNKLKYYIILADPKLIGSNKEYRIVGNFFYCAAQEAYEVLAHKLVIFYSYIYQETDFDFVYKVDDGCLLNQNNIKKIPSTDYSGILIKPTSNTCHAGKCKTSHYNTISLDFMHCFDKLPDIDRDKLTNITNITYAGGGYGYVLSRNALHSISKYKNHVLGVCLSYEDVIFGQILYLENITPTHHTVGKYHAVA
jgi:hypothetical protein